MEERGPGNLCLEQKEKRRRQESLVGKPVSSCCSFMSVAVIKYSDNEQNREGKGLLGSHSALQSIFVGKPQRPELKTPGYSTATAEMEEMKLPILSARPHQLTIKRGSHRPTQQRQSINETLSPSESRFCQVDS